MATIKLSNQDITDLKKVRNYFVENSRSIFEHTAYDIIVKIINKPKVNQDIPTAEQLEQFLKWCKACGWIENTDRVIEAMANMYAKR